MTATFVIDDQPGEKTLLVEDAANDRLLIQRQFDSQGAVDELARIRQVTDGRSKTGEMYYVGSIPPAVIEEYLIRKGVTYHDFLADPAHIRSIMLDSDYKDLRVWQGTY